MTQSFIQPKGTLKPQTNIEDIQKQYAQLVSQPQAQPAEQKEQDMLRQTVNDLVKSALMNPVEIPKPYKTIQDVFNANNGDRFKALGDWFNSPQFNRFAGGDLTFNPETKRMESTGTRIGREQEARLNADREKALEQQKQQLGIANDVYNAYNRMDIANEENALRRDLAEQELKFRKEENALDRGLKREQLNAMIAHQRAMEGIARQRAAANNKQEKELQKNLDNIKSLNAIQGQLDRFKGSFKDANNPIRYRAFGGVSEKLNTLSKNEANFNAQRTLLFNKIARDLGGEKGVLSDQDIKRIEQALPTLSDTIGQKNAKIQAIYDLLDDRKQQYGVAAGASMSNLNNAMNIGGYTVEIE